VENRLAVPPNFTFFNVLLLFAQFQCNPFSPKRRFFMAPVASFGANLVK
jgi:hypothetical protein